MYLYIKICPRSTATKGAHGLKKKKKKENNEREGSIYTSSSSSSSSKAIKLIARIIKVFSSMWGCCLCNQNIKVLCTKQFSTNVLVVSVCVCVYVYAILFLMYCKYRVVVVVVVGERVNIMYYSCTGNTFSTCEGFFLGG